MCDYRMCTMLENFAEHESQQQLFASGNDDFKIKVIIPQYWSENLFNCINNLPFYVAVVSKLQKASLDFCIARILSVSDDDQTIRIGN